MSNTQDKLAHMQAMFGTSDTNQQSRPSNYYRFWDMNYGETATVRLLPDGNENNPMEFMVEKLMHNLEINGERKSVPCMKMYDRNAQCPICNVSSAFYKEEGDDSPNGKKYWRKKQHIFQALIVEDPIAPNQETGENSVGKIMYLNFGFQLYSVIKEAMTNGSLQAYPWITTEGYDLIIKKTEQGGNAKYDLGSRFATDITSLSEDELALVAEESIDLATLIPPQMDYDKMEAMLTASLTGEHYDDGFNGGNAQQAAPVASTPAATPSAESIPVVEQAAPIIDTPAATPAAESKPAPDAAGYADEGNAVLEMIRNRKSAEV